MSNILINSEDLPPIMPSAKDIAEISLMTKNGNKFQLICGVVIYYEIRKVH